ncbi:hypothetical protein O6H91_12G011200 [Diphasiastrum complanatum]|uniref:Uncharacterized protein n=1 Tax=Diphasiastrum complanatum TaxID=34168 RepID=A0ACC2BYT4_DIPCM|nr:hypothetical protein O6H91_Y134000 [Diphasiastrum complanatum]KAJ7534942.1 hypothetical protein O6H91_12G011200 [Diphasiastrum complanatum]
MDGDGPHLACLFCTQNCYNTHGEGKPPGPTIPAFCKIMTESIVAKDSSNSFLELPTAFVKQYRHELHKTTILEGPSGQTWSVDVWGSKCNMSFKKGWSAFSIDHNLQEGDIVIFKLTTKAYFVVQVFDRDGSEKDLYSVQNSVAFAVQNGIGSSKRRQKQICPQNSLTEKTCKRLKRVKVAHTSHLVFENRELIPNSENGHENKEGLHSTSCINIAQRENRKKLRRCILKESSVLNMVDSGADDSECDDINLLQDLINRCKTASATICQEEARGSSCMSQAILKKDISLDFDKQKNVFGRRQRHNFNRQGSKTLLLETNILCVRPVSNAMAAAKSHSINHPTVIVKMRRSNVTGGFWLYMERSFARQWLPMVDTLGFLVNAAGSRWLVKWLCKRGGFSAGWRRFSQDHGLQEEDVCLFELTSRAPFIFTVHMFRHILARFL